MVWRGIAGMSAFLIWSASAALAQSSEPVPVVNSAVLGLNMSVPWSQPVRVNDPFEGDFLAVFDRNYFPSRFLQAERVDVVSLWSRQTIRVLLAARNRNCIIDVYDSIWGHACAEIGVAQKVSQLLVRVGDRVFRLENKDGTFPVSADLATALQTAPEGNVNIRLITERGETVDSLIGKDTVRSWRTVYANS